MYFSRVKDTTGAEVSLSSKRDLLDRRAKFFKKLQIETRNVFMSTNLKQDDRRVLFEYLEGEFSTRFECGFPSFILVSSVVFHLLHPFRV